MAAWSFEDIRTQIERAHDSLRQEQAELAKRKRLGKLVDFDIERLQEAQLALLRQPPAENPAEVTG